MTTPQRNLIGERFAGLLLGTAVGDALGLPAENLSALRILHRWRGKWRMRLLFGKGMVSDDTEHTLMVAQALLTNPADATIFQRRLAWKMRWWFIGLPAGVGLATAKACIKLWLGFPPDRCAVKSAGSGPATRSAILGAYFADDSQKRRDFVLASSRLTHRSWQAETAALAVAESVALTITTECQPKLVSAIAALRQLSSESEWLKIVGGMEESLRNNISVKEFAGRIGLESAVSGYALHVVPVALYAWLRHWGDFHTALVSAIECGGDTDTVGAIVGALAGATVGENGIPSQWRKDLWEWPRSCSVIEQIASRLADQKSSGRSGGPVCYFWPAQLLRNLLFLATVLVHGFRRLFPPY